MAKNIQSLQLLRNTSQLYATREAALAVLTGSIPAGTQDGTPVLARYKGTDGKIYTLVGYYAASSAITGGDSATSNMTVFDFEGSAADVEELKQKIGSGVTAENNVTKQLQDLSGNSVTSVSADTSVEGAKRYADEKVRAELDKLDYNLTKDDNKVVVSFEQKDGKISGTSENITSVKLGGYTVGADADIAATDTLGEALGKLQGQINGMDKNAEAVDGQVVTTVAEADGKVTETKANVKDLQLGGYSKDTAATGAIASADTINTALSKLENKAAAITIANDDKSINVTTSTTGTNINVNIKSGEHVLAKGGDAGLYTNIAISAVTGTELSELGTNVKEAYKLVGTDSTILGDYIKIYKDSSLYEVYLGHMDDTIAGDPPVVTDGTGDTALCFIYHKENGTYELVPVNVEEFLSETEFKDGLQVNNHEVSVKVDTSSEKVTTGANVTADVLTVGSNGVKVNNIQNAIDYAVSTLDATVTGGTTAGTATNGHIQVVVAEADGKLTGVTVTETNIADKSLLETLSAKTVTEVASSNESITAALSAATDGTKHLDIITDASKIKMTGFTSTDVLSGINATSSVTEAFKEVDKVITDNEQVVSTALDDLDTRVKAEIAARKAVDGQNGETYAANATVPYISAATSLNDADVKLANALASFENDGIKGVQVNGVDLPETSSKVNVQIEASSNAADSANAIVITQDNQTGKLTLALGTIDAGTY